MNISCNYCIKFAMVLIYMYDVASRFIIHKMHSTYFFYVSMKDLTVFFNCGSYFVPEGKNQVLVLNADKQFEVPFKIDVSLTNINAVGKCLQYILITVGTVS